MVKHGKSKKGRSVSRQNKAMKNSYQVAKYKNPKGLFSNDEVKNTWNPSETPLENLKRMGLQIRANDDVKKPSGKNVVNTVKGDASKAIELFDIPADGRIKGRTKADVMLPISIDDQEYIVKLLKKHKNLNFKKIAMDTKTNSKQLSRAKVKKLARKFYELKEEERVVECPDFVIELLEGFEEMSDDE